MKQLLTIILFCSLMVPAYGAFGAKTVWYVATTGANTNGGAFDAGVASPGTDESATATAITLTTASTTTATCSPACSATTHGPGNFIHIASGTGCTVGWHEMTSQAAGTATFDAAIAGAGGDTCVGTIGGPLLTLAQLATNVAVGGNIACVQAGTYQISSGVTFAGTAHLQGYTTTCGVNGAIGDMGKPLIQITAAGVVAITLSGSVSSIANFQFDANGQTGNTIAVSAAGSQVVGSNILTAGFFKGWAQTGGSGLTIWNSRFHGGAASCGAGVALTASGASTLIGVLSDHNACDGIGVSGGSFVCINTVSADNTGISNGFTIAAPANAMAIIGCGAYNNPVDGFSFASAQAVFGTIILNTWAWGNTTHSFDATAGSTNTFAFDYNAYASGSLNNIVLQTTTSHIITLTADPTVGCGNATPNCVLNNTAGGGLLLNQTGFPSVLVSYLGAGYTSIGPLVPQFGPTGAGGGSFAFVQ